MYNMSISAAADVQRLVHRFVQNIGECLCSFFVFSKVHNGCIISCYNHCCACMEANNHTYLSIVYLKPVLAGAGWVIWVKHLNWRSIYSCCPRHSSHLLITAFTENLMWCRHSAPTRHHKAEETLITLMQHMDRRKYLGGGKSVFLHWWPTINDWND